MNNIVYLLQTSEISIPHDDGMTQTGFAYSSAGVERLSLSEGAYFSRGYHSLNSSVEVKRDSSGIKIISENESDLYSLVSNLVNNSSDLKSHIGKFSSKGRRLLEDALDSYDTGWRVVLGVGFVN